MTEFKNLRAMTISELEAAVTLMGFEKYRATQIFNWLHVKLARSLDDMKNIPAALKTKLLENYELNSVTEVTVLKSQIDGTCKFLFRLYDGNVIESVLMRYEHGNSVCISSQVGCRMGCNFCASTIGGRIRDLDAGEMLDQIYYIMNYDKSRVQNVVVMGTGEPFDNFDNFVRFYELLTDEKGYNLSGRNVTVSTCGITEKIRELADMQFSLTLAISLHSPTDELRRSFMPIANKYTINDILEATDYFFSKTGRRVTFEYSLISGVNDTPECAQKLADLLRGRAAHVNLIPVNPIKEREYKRSNTDAVQAFKNILEKKRINATIRRGMGKDIDAACGQLRRKYLDTKEV